MKFYIAARLRQKERVKLLISRLEECGYKNITPWLDDKNIKPYENNLDLARKYALRCIVAMRKCDIFILLSNNSGTGMYTEFGIALLLNILFKNPQIYIVGKYLSGTIFFFHPLIKRVNNINKLMQNFAK